MSTVLLRRAGAWVYILECRDGSLYTGATKDLDRRIREHEAGKASRYTRARLPVRLVYSEWIAGTIFAWSKALKREAEIKKMTRARKLKLVASHARRSAG